MKQKNRKSGFTNQKTSWEITSSKLQVTRYSRMGAGDPSRNARVAFQAGSKAVITGSSSWRRRLSADSRQLRQTLFAVSRTTISGCEHGTKRGTKRLLVHLFPNALKCHNEIPFKKYSAALNVRMTSLVGRCFFDTRMGSFP